jgi:hypothetical protein
MCSTNPLQSTAYGHRILEFNIFDKSMHEVDNFQGKNFSTFLCKFNHAFYRVINILTFILNYYRTCLQTNIYLHMMKYFLFCFNGWIRFLCNTVKSISECWWRHRLNESSRVCNSSASSSLFHSPGRFFWASCCTRSILWINKFILILLDWWPNPITAKRSID